MAIIKLLSPGEDISLGMSVFADTITKQKYAHDKPDGTKETWEEIAYRVASNVLKAVNAPKSQIKATAALIAQRKFIPGGRYLYASGRAYHQCQNCLLFRAEDSREGWSELMQKQTLGLMTGAGTGTVYSDVRAEGKAIRRTGGQSTGPLALMQMVNEAGRGIMQGGSRRAAIWAGLHWWHPDAHRFIHLKDWSLEVRALKEKDFNFPATMDMTNVSIILDDAFFKAYHNENNAKHPIAYSIYWDVIKQMRKTGEPGFSIDTGINVKENLRNAPVTAGTHILTIAGYKPVSSLIGRETSVWTGSRYAHKVVFKETNEAAPILKVTMTGGRVIRCDASHPFIVDRGSLDRIPASILVPGDIIHSSLPKPLTKFSTPVIESYTLGFLYGDGTFTKSGNADVSFCVAEKIPCLTLIRKDKDISSINESDGRGFVRVYFRVKDRFAFRSKSLFPSEVFSYSAKDLASFLAGLFDADGSAVAGRVRLSSIHREFLRGVGLALEQLGILSHVSKSGYSGYCTDKQAYQLSVSVSFVSLFASVIPTQRLKPDKSRNIFRAAQIKVLSVESDGNESVYCADVGVDEHTFVAEGVVISNCTEVTSEDDSDICNLGSINLSRIISPEEMTNVVELSTAFLLAGTVYSDVPFAKVDQIRTKNRRLGLGLMGIHEWLLQRGKKYAPDVELGKLLEIYANSGDVANSYADKWDISHPLKTRAIAPTGSIGIIAETTTGIEPIFCVAYKRRYLKHRIWNYQYVIDPAAERLVAAGVNPENIEDAYSIDEERRINFQAWVQRYVDHAISSTINLPFWGSESNNESTVHEFGDMLLDYLPQLRGMTCYPDGARGGQPLTPVKYATAVKHLGKIYQEEGEEYIAPIQIESKLSSAELTDEEAATPIDICDLTKSGTCGG